MSETMSTRDTLLAYSEWLDSQGLIRGDDDKDHDCSHEELAQEFIGSWEASADRKVLAGRPLERLAENLARLKLSFAEMK